MQEARAILEASQVAPIMPTNPERRDVWTSLVFTGHMRYFQGPGLSRWPELLAAAERACGLAAGHGQYVPARILAESCTPS